MNCAHAHAHAHALREAKAKSHLNWIYIVGSNSVETHTVVQEVKKRELERGR